MSDQFQFPDDREHVASVMKDLDGSLSLSWLAVNNSLHNRMAELADDEKAECLSIVERLADLGTSARKLTERLNQPQREYADLAVGT